MTVEGLESGSAGSLGLSGDGAMLVRPDGAVVGRWDSAAAAPYEVRTAVGSLARPQTRPERLSA